MAEGLAGENAHADAATNVTTQATKDRLTNAKRPQRSQRGRIKCGLHSGSSKSFGEVYVTFTALALLFLEVFTRI